MFFLNIYKIHNCGYFLYKKKYYKLSKIFEQINYIFHNSILPSSVKIEKDVKFAYNGIGFVIHSKTIIGNNVMIGQNVTIGAKLELGMTKAPKIENNVYIGAGARILGPIIIGHDSIIAPNSVILKDVLPCTIIAGIPGKVIGRITKENIIKYKMYGIKNYEEVN